MAYTIKSLYDELDENFQKHLNESEDSRCLLDLLKFSAADLMPRLVSYLLNFYTTDKNVFCFNGVELSISLEDVLFLTGLPIDGKAVISHKIKDADGFNRVFQLPNEKFKSNKVMRRIATDVSLDDDQRKRAVLLLIVNCFIVPSSSNAGRVSTTYLRYIEDFSEVDSYAWGAALLAFLYHGIADFKKKKDLANDARTTKKSLDGNTWVILSFFILRIPKLRDQLSLYMKLPINLNVDQLQIPFMPQIVDQLQKMSHNHRADFEGFTGVLDSIFLNLSNDDVMWTPYAKYYHPQQKFGTRIGPIICNNFVVHHTPHIAYRQFPVFENYHLESLEWEHYNIDFKKNSGPSEQDFAKLYKKEVDWWTAKKLAQDLMKEKTCISSPSSQQSQDYIQQNDHSPSPQRSTQPHPSPIWWSSNPQPSLTLHFKPGEKGGKEIENMEELCDGGAENQNMKEKTCISSPSSQKSQNYIQQNDHSPSPQRSTQPHPSPICWSSNPQPSLTLHFKPGEKGGKEIENIEELCEEGRAENQNMGEERILECLEPGILLDERVIYHYVSYLKRTVPSNAFLLLNTYNYVALAKAKKASAQDIRMGWWKGGFEKYSYILFPMCFDSHFSLAIVCFMGEGEAVGHIEILHLDSLEYHQKDQIFDTIVWTLKQKWGKGRAASDFPPTVTRTVEVPQQTNKYDCALFVIHMMELFIQQAPPRFNDNLKMFGLKWFNPLDASALRARIKPIIAEELKRRVFEGENVKGDVNVPERNVNVPEKKKRKRRREPLTNMAMKLRSNVKTVGGHFRKRKDVHYNQSRTGYKDNIVDSRIKVWWEDDKKYYNGVIAAFNTLTKKHQVRYDDGDEEFLHLGNEKWDFI